MASSVLYADVILPLPVTGTFTYRIGKNQESMAKPGMRVSVQFGKRKIYTAIIRNFHHTEPENYEVKEIISLLDDYPIVNDLQFKLWDWIAGYYMCTIGEVYNAALPSGLKLDSETRIYALSESVDNADLNESEGLLLQVLKDNKGHTLSDLQKTAGINATLTVKSLLDKKLVILEEKIRDRYKPKMQTIIRLAQEYDGPEKINELIEKLQRAPARCKILMAYLTLSKSYVRKNIGGVEKLVLLEKAETSATVLTALIKMGIFESDMLEVSRLNRQSESSGKSVSLNEYQVKALENIKESMQSHDVTLLHGVTSSGKTEIYFHLIEDALQNGKQVLYLLPEIALTAQMINRLQNVFGKKVAVYHSKFSDSERVETWNNLVSTDKPGNKIQIILGVRSSVFLPFSNLGLIIIDEEHENTYKQFDPAPRYHARDTAIILARLHGAKVLLGTATPSIETYYNCKTSKYGLVELSERYLDLELPEIKIVNVREARRRKQMQSHFSPVLTDHITTALNNHEQIILFQNRRGFSIYLECELCGWVPHCPHCDVSLTYHKKFNRLNCHYCGYSIPVPVSCKTCGSNTLLMHGFGTEKIEDEIALFYPQARVSRMDLDSTRKRKSYEKIIGEFETRAVDILVGTQMVSKGLHFDNVKIVGIMDSDAMFNFPDFRAYERSFQLMTQVSGRAGRKNGRGIVIIQTSDHNHPVLSWVANNDYQAMYQSQLNERRQFNYPPFSRLIEITLKHRDKDILDKATDGIAQLLKPTLKQGIIGPEYPLISRIQNLYLKRMLVKIERNRSLPEVKAFITQKIRELQGQPAFKSVQPVIDVDPY